MKNIGIRTKWNKSFLEKSLDFTKVTGLFINGTHVSIYGIDNKTVDKQKFSTNIDFTGFVSIFLYDTKVSINGIEKQMKIKHYF